MKNILLVLVIVFLPLHVSAEESLSQDGFDFHYNVFPTLSLTKDVAKNYKIKRSNKRGMVNISVTKNNDKGLAKAVEAEVIFMVKNLYGQDKTFDVRKISENDGAIYYIGTFPISNGETLNFNVYITPSGSQKQAHIKFNREFFTD